MFFKTAASALTVCEITLVGVISIFKKVKQIKIENTMCIACGINEYYFVTLSF